VTRSRSVGSGSAATPKPATWGFAFSLTRPAFRAAGSFVCVTPRGRIRRSSDARAQPPTRPTVYLASLLNLQKGGPSPVIRVFSSVDFEIPRNLAAVSVSQYSPI